MTAAVSPSTVPQSSTARLEVRIVDARSERLAELAEGDDLLRCGGVHDVVHGGE